MSARTRPAACCVPEPVKSLSTPRVETLASVGKALADPCRIQILHLLSGQPGPLCACDIVARFELSQPTVSHHLKILRSAGLVASERCGLWMFYELATDARDILQSVASILMPAVTPAQSPGAECCP